MAEQKFPTCINLTIEFNPFAVYHESLEDWLNGEGREIEWASDEERQRAMETGSVWVCQWYPDTPIGFYRIAASTFDALMAAVNAQVHTRG